MIFFLQKTTGVVLMLFLRWDQKNVFMKERIVTTTTKGNVPSSLATRKELTTKKIKVITYVIENLIMRFDQELPKKSSDSDTEGWTEVIAHKYSFWTKVTSRVYWWIEATDTYSKLHYHDVDSKRKNTAIILDVYQMRPT